MSKGNEDNNARVVGSISDAESRSLEQELVKIVRESSIRLDEITPLQEMPSTPIWNTIKKFQQSQNTMKRMMGYVLNAIFTCKRPFFIFSRGELENILELAKDRKRTTLSGKDYNQFLAKFASQAVGHGQLLLCHCPPVQSKGAAGVYGLANESLMQCLLGDIGREAFTLCYERVISAYNEKVVKSAEQEIEERPSKESSKVDSTSGNLRPDLFSINNGGGVSDGKQATTPTNFSGENDGGKRVANGPDLTQAPGSEQDTDPSNSSLDRNLVEWQERCLALSKTPSITVWEVQFLKDIMTRPENKLNPKQRDKFDEIEGRSRAIAKPEKNSAHLSLEHYDKIFRDKHGGLSRSEYFHKYPGGNKGEAIDSANQNGFHIDDVVEDKVHGKGKITGFRFGDLDSGTQIMAEVVLENMPDRTGHFLIRNLIKVASSKNYNRRST